MNAANKLIPLTALNRSNASGVVGSMESVEMKAFPVSLYLKSMPVFPARAIRYEDGSFWLGSLGAEFHRTITNQDIDSVKCSFEAVLTGELFTDWELTAVWRKLDKHTGECAASDSGVKVGHVSRFDSNDKVNVVLMEEAA